MATTPKRNARDRRRAIIALIPPPAPPPPPEPTTADAALAIASDLQAVAASLRINAQWAADLAQRADALAAKLRTPVG